jgi:hypothetical protein
MMKIRFLIPKVLKSMRYESDMTGDRIIPTPLIILSSQLSPRAMK